MKQLVRVVGGCLREGGVLYRELPGMLNGPAGSRIAGVISRFWFVHPRGHCPEDYNDFGLKSPVRFEGVKAEWECLV